MDANLKSFNDAVLDYSISSARQVFELNTKLWRDTIELNKTIVSLYPGLEFLAPVYKR